MNRTLETEACPVCGQADSTYLFTVRHLTIHRCRVCGLVRLASRPSSQAVHGSGMAEGEQVPLSPDVPPDGPTESEAWRTYLAALDRVGAARSRLLVIAPPHHPLAALSSAPDYELDMVVSLDRLQAQPLPAGHFGTAVVVSQLEKTSDPVDVLRKIHAALSPDGILLIVLPSLDSWTARFLRHQWTEWRPDNRCYFDRNTVQSTLWRAGFGEVAITAEQREYSLHYLYLRSHVFPRTAFTRAIRWLHRLMPKPLSRRVHFRLATARMIVTARRLPPRERPLLSIVMPVFNERASVETVIEAVLAKPLAGLDKELIVVESNSTDGTREAVLAYRDHPAITLVLQDRPQGKGHAVRTGFSHINGDLVLIQDADTEYDVDDYDDLLQPLLTFRTAFVLGSRHTGDWKIRKFDAEPRLESWLNLGHLLFVTLLNRLYGQKLKDPFTMFKVFRRDCLHGLAFECDRFDFDFELVIKLVRKGYVPLEVPVNYRARSWAEGKKIRVLRDPLTWMRALIKFRFVRITGA